MTISRTKERQARELAARHYDTLAKQNKEGPVPGNTFLDRYPTKEGYVKEWWEERYLPTVIGYTSRYQGSSDGN